MIISSSFLTSAAERMKYSRVSADDGDEDLSLDDLSSHSPPHDPSIPLSVSSNNGKIRHETVPISKPPSQRRDPLYFYAFLLIFLLLILFSSIIQRKPLHGSLIPAAYAGNWASMIMIAPLLATFTGVGLFLILLFHHNLRQFLMQYSLTLSLLSTVCLGNIILLTTEHWYLGLGILLTLLWDSLRYHECHDNLASDLTMMELIESINEPYNGLLLYSGVAIVITNMFFLLWWGVITIYTLSELSLISGLLLLPLLVFALYWISNFLHYYLASLIGGCVFWTFHRAQDNSLYDYTMHESQLFLYLQVSSSSCIGSLCKSALFCPFYQSILTIMNILEWKVSTITSSFSLVRCFINSVTPLLLSIYHSTSLESISRQYHRLATLYISAYGHTHHTASHLIQRKHPHLLDLISIDTLGYRVQLLINWSSISLSLLLVAMASIETSEIKKIWIIFFFFCYILCYYCISLSLYGLVVACDALYLGAYDYPEVFLSMSPILYHRLERINEIELS